MDAILSTRRRRLVLGGVGVLAVFPLAGCGRSDGGVVHFGGQTMGSTYNVKLARTKSDTATLHDEVQAALDAVDRRMSIFRADSELSVFNRAGRGAFAMSPELFGVLEAAREVSAWSDGAFDVTVAPLVESWGFGTVKKRTVPAEAEVRGHRASVGWRGLVLDRAACTVLKTNGATRIDLGGIAKGYGVDAAAAVLERRGIVHYMIEVGGEVRTSGLNAKGEAWRIGIEEPDAMPQRARHVVPLAGRSMATSGDYRNYFEQGGRRYSHEIDPATGAPVAHSLASVTVVARDCMRADALATALIVLGETGFELAEASGVAAQFIVRRGAELIDRETTAFAVLGARRA